MRHAQLAAMLGVESALVTSSGRDTYGSFNIVNVPIIPWHSIRDDDVCVLPDFCADLTDRLRCRVIVYFQAPHLIRSDFEYRHPRVRMWTDSPFMLDHCRKLFPDKDIKIVPNVVDPEAFPFRAQSDRETGLIIAFPRKGPEFIEATREEYRKRGRSYWRFELIGGLSLQELSREMRRPQAFLASADVEGCALPPQECMAAGIVVVGKNARGANFSMAHRETAIVAETPEEAARGLIEIEDAALRDSISHKARDYISRFFPSNEPTRLWEETLAELRS